MKKKLYSGVVSTFLAATLASAAEFSGNEADIVVTDRQILQYKMGIELGCRDAGSSRGDSRAAIRQACGCAIDYLGRSVSEKEWRMATHSSLKRNEQAEFQVLGPHYRALGTHCRRPRTSEGELSPEPVPSLIGRWEWTRSPNKCQEIYQFEADGTVRVSSGAEKTEGTYKLSESSESTTRYALLMTTTKDNGQLDCGNSNADDTGTSSTTYPFITYSGEVMMMCYSAKGKDCFGPLFRIER